LKLQRYNKYGHKSNTFIAKTDTFIANIPDISVSFYTVQEFKQLVWQKKLRWVFKFSLFLPQKIKSGNK
jgi:hypothetical protein